ncbi:hypothetical protein [Cellulomonas sp. S1-8]|uniref:hypothetical protein n=1 Tax=Cellulomonas sp. S1-8 TaxID=2904790 RepID=UPI002244472D|nr:hypothetical protein [Cellulomonas sp. S1-8]UZN02234.1 hypothetical protein OKX07_14200 [Cellulomonas sp. S1-8]
MRPARVAAAAAVALLASVALVGPAAAVDVAWEGPTLSLAWDGSTRASAEQSFVGVPVTVPGDRARRAVTVRNDGPTGGTLQAWVTQVDLLDPAAGADDGFYDDLHLDWATASQTDGATFRALEAAGDTLIAQTHLPQGAVTRIEVAYELPATATTGNRGLVGEREASFVVHVQITGDTATPAPTSAPSPTATPAPSPTTGEGVAADPGPTTTAAGTVAAAPAAGNAATLALTGLDALRAALLAVVGIGFGSLLVGAARRRRDVQQPGGSGTAPTAG